MARLLLSTFGRCVARNDGVHKVKSIWCLDRFFAMTFVQLTLRESARDIAAWLASQVERLYHVGYRPLVFRNMLVNSDAVRP